MKNLNKLLHCIVALSCLIGLTSCAAGAATSGYALKAQSADSLTANAEQRIVDRAKKEFLAEMTKGNPGMPYGQQ